MHKKQYTAIFLCFYFSIIHTSQSSDCLQKRPRQQSQAVVHLLHLQHAFDPGNWRWQRTKKLWDVGSYKHIHTSPQGYFTLLVWNKGPQEKWKAAHCVMYSPSTSLCLVFNVHIRVCYGNQAESQVSSFTLSRNKQTRTLNAGDTIRKRPSKTH